MSHFRELVSKCMSTIKFIRRIVRLDPDPGNICLYGGPLHSGPLRIEMDPGGREAFPVGWGLTRPAPAGGCSLLGRTGSQSLGVQFSAWETKGEGAYTIPYHR